jgi:hypothetical protein
LLLTAFVGLLFPILGSETNYRAYFFQNFRWFLGLQFLWFCLDVVEVTVTANLGLRPVPGDYFLLVIPLMLGLLIGVFVKIPGYHGFLAVSVFALNIVYGVLISVAIS